MKLPKIKEIAPSIFLVTFDKAYDLAMTFVRYQEYYESPKFKGQFFKLSDFMSWYAKKYGNGVFSYPKDFDGFNLPSEILFKVYTTLEGDKYDTITEHDKIMGKILMKLWDENKTYFYLVGVSKETRTRNTILHEMAHALYAINTVYRCDVVDLVNKLPQKVKAFVFKKLKDRGYHKDVFADELNAYMATGLYKGMSTTMVQQYRIGFKGLFKKYYNGKIRNSCRIR